MTLDEVYEVAEKQGIEIDEIKMRSLKALSVPEGCIAIDFRKFRTRAALKTALAHEMGHITSGAFYALDAPDAERAQCEYKADKRAALLLIPPEDLKKAMRAGAVEAWQLAEVFDVPERFIRRALYIYRSKAYL